jgi:hypothetical protein
MDPVVGGQRCGIVWADLGSPFLRADVPDLRGEISLWKLEGTTWCLARTDGSGPFATRGLAAGEVSFEPPTREFFVDASVQSVIGLLPPRGPDQPAPLELKPLRGATVRIIAGGGGTPTWDSPQFQSDETGMVRIGPLHGSDDLWLDVSAPGHASIRRFADPHRALLRSEGPAQVWLPLGVERKGRVTVRGHRPSGTVRLSTRVSSVSDRELYIPVRPDGTFEIVEPRFVGMRYEAYLEPQEAGGRLAPRTVLERTDAAGDIVIDIADR